MLADTSNGMIRISDNPPSLRAHFCRTDVGKKKFAKEFFLHGMYSCDIKTAPTLNTFKSRYDNYVKNSNLF